MSVSIVCVFFVCIIYVYVRWLFGWQTTNTANSCEAVMLYARLKRDNFRKPWQRLSEFFGIYIYTHYSGLTRNGSYYIVMRVPANDIGCVIDNLHDVQCDVVAVWPSPDSNSSSWMAFFASGYRSLRLHEPETRIASGVSQAHFGQLAHSTAANVGHQ